MKSHAALEAETFDGFAAEYDAALTRGIGISGEPKEYFARERVRWLSERLQQLNVRPQTVMDFGCGTGTATPFLLSIPGVQQLVGVDTSVRSLNLARVTWDPTRAQFQGFDPARAATIADLAFCNGVFHHIEPRERLDALDYIHRALKPRGYFAFWENNPWNPGARYVMSRIPFDRDAQLISPVAARKLLAQVGFVVIRIDFLFIFPRLLRLLRPVEARVACLPLGAQYLVLCQKVGPLGVAAR